MKKILLLCNAGMSTSMLVNKMQKEAQKQSLDYDIEAKSLTEGKELISNYDCVLLGPQVRYELSNVQSIQNEVPVDVIDMRDYGMMDATAVLNKASSMMGD